MSPEQKALEFAEYMAKDAERFIEAYCAESELRVRREESDDVDDDTMWDATTSIGEHMRSLRSGIYAFRKRADKAKPVTADALPPVPLDDEEPDFATAEEAATYWKSLHNHLFKAPMEVPALTPLTEMQIIDATEDIDTSRDGYFIRIARAIEHAHGIGRAALAAVPALDVDAALGHQAGQSIPGARTEGEASS